MQRKRAIKNYIRGIFIIDLAYLIVLVICLGSGSFSANNGKYICLTKVVRLFEIDDYFLRRFNVKRIKKTIYTILKLVFTIVIISHAIGVLFYVLDYYIYINGIFEPTCNVYITIKSAGFSTQLLMRLLQNCHGLGNISTHFIGESTPLLTFHMETFKALIPLKQLTCFFV